MQFQPNYINGFAAVVMVDCDGGGGVDSSGDGDDGILVVVFGSVLAYSIRATSIHETSCSRLIRLPICVVHDSSVCVCV